MDMVKNFEDIFIRFGATHERDRQTDGLTPHAGNSRAMHSIARQKLHCGTETKVTRTHELGVFFQVTTQLQYIEDSEQLMH